jgi:hypothetical protein
MPSITASTEVSAPPAVVFGLLNTPNESVRSGQSQSFDDVTELPNGGHEYDYTFRMVGVPLTGTVRTVEHAAPERLALEYTGDIAATITFELDALDDDRTALRADAEYEMPGTVLGAVAGPVVERYNQTEIEGFVENTRDRAEARYDPDGDEYGTYGLGDAPWTPEPMPVTPEHEPRSE